MRRFILIFAICTGVLWGGPVGADDEFGDYIRASDAFRRGDYAEAFDIFRVLAEKGDHIPAAQFKLGLLYSNGRGGVLQNYVQAHKWFNLSAAQGDMDARMAELLRDRLAKKMTPAQIAEAQRLAAEWRPKK